MTAGPAIAPAPAPASPRARRVATPRWLDLRLVLGVVLVLASVVVGARVVSGASSTHPAVAVTRDLAAGTTLTADDLRVTQVRLPDRSLYAAAVTDVVGKRLARPLGRGELVPRTAVAAVPPQTTLTVPLGAQAAPRLRTGQRIEVWVSAGRCTSVVLLPDVTVQAVHDDASGALTSGSGGQDVVVSVDPVTARRVVQALALESVTLRAGVLSGATGADTPGDLSACASPTSPPTR